MAEWSALEKITEKEAIEEIEKISKGYPHTPDEAYRVGDALTLAVESLNILSYAKENLQFKIEHSEGEEKDHYQRALNLLTKKPI